MKQQTASERAKAKAVGSEQHPADRFDDPLTAKLADQPEAVLAKKPRLAHIGGSKSDDFNVSIANAVLGASWFTNTTDQQKAVINVGHALAGVKPQDELEGMVAAQLVAAHNASMECFRRAMIPDQSLDGRAMNLNQANKASRTFAALLEALNRHRGKGQQKVTVEHVHVHQGGQAIVGHVEGGGAQRENRRQPDAPRLTNAPQPLAPMWCEDAPRDAVPVAGDAKRPMSNARGSEPRRAQRTR